MMTENEIPIIVWADVETAPLGQRSKLLDDFAGRPLLRQTMERACRTKRSGKKVIICPPEQVEAVRSAVGGLPVEVVGVKYDLPGWWPGLCAARKWAMDGWRGGLMGACAFDEDLLVHVAGSLARQLGTPALLSISAHGAWIDPEILDRQIERYLENREQMKINFTQAPPGLAGLVAATDLVEKLPTGGKLAGTSLGYHPDQPQIDPISQACNLPLEPSVIHMAQRFICDTNRTLALSRAMANRIDPLTANMLDVVEAARQEVGRVEEFPREIELEAISGWPWEKGYRPASDRLRGPLAVDKILDRVAELARDCDDLLVHVGGFGEPTRHSQFAELIRGLKQAGAFGIAVATTGVFDPSVVETLAELPIDIVSVRIDIPQRELYLRVTGLDGYETVWSTIERLAERTQSLRRAVPLVVPVMIKTHETMGLMDEFFDGWMRRLGWAVIEGFSNYAGQIPDRAVHSMAGPKRKPCRQIGGRLTILADGQAVICDQDFNARITAGSLANQTLAEIWRGKVLTDLRTHHREEHFDVNPLCEKCHQWHRA